MEINFRKKVTGNMFYRRMKNYVKCITNKLLIFYHNLETFERKASYPSKYSLAKWNQKRNVAIQQIILLSKEARLKSAMKTHVMQHSRLLLCTLQLALLLSTTPNMNRACLILNTIWWNWRKNNSKMGFNVTTIQQNEN